MLTSFQFFMVGQAEQKTLPMLNMFEIGLGCHFSRRTHVRQELIKNFGKSWEEKFRGI